MYALDNFGTLLVICFFAYILLYLFSVAKVIFSLRRFSFSHLNAGVKNSKVYNFCVFSCIPGLLAIFYFLLDANFTYDSGGYEFYFLIFLKFVLCSHALFALFSFFNMWIKPVDDFYYYLMLTFLWGVPGFLLFFFVVISFYNYN